MAEQFGLQEQHDDDAQNVIDERQPKTNDTADLTGLGVVGFLVL